MIKREITRNYHNILISEYLQKKYPQIENIKKYIKQGEMRLNGIPVKKDFSLNEGDVLDLYLPQEIYTLQTINIVYEDSNLIIINKMQGVPITAPKGSYCLMDFVVDYMRSKGEIIESTGNVPFACYKLDDNTGGLAMFAKNSDVYDAVRTAFRERRLRRVFKAIICGEPKYTHGEFAHFYLADDKGRVKISSDKSINAMPIYTKYDVITTNGEYSEVYLEPVTQIYNQERMQTQIAGYNILGDQLYGNPKINKQTGVWEQALWLTEIEFISGVRNILEYMNGKNIVTTDVVFPYVEM